MHKGTWLSLPQHPLHLKLERVALAAARIHGNLTAALSRVRRRGIIHFQREKNATGQIILEAEGADEKNCFFLVIVLKFTHDFFYT